MSLEVYILPKFDVTNMYATSDEWWHYKKDFVMLDTLNYIHIHTMRLVVAAPLEVGSAEVSGFFAPKRARK